MAISVQPVEPSGLRSIWNAVSSELLSVQPRSICAVETVVAARRVGAFGGGGLTSVVAVAWSSDRSGSLVVVLTSTVWVMLPVVAKSMSTDTV